MSGDFATTSGLLRASRLPRSESLALAVAATGWPRERLLAHPDATWDVDVATRLRDWVARREAGEPLAYLTGRRAFFGRDFAVGPAVLIPRPETELLVDRGLEVLREAGALMPRILDLGTGSGVLAITFALEWPGSVVGAVDRSTEALAVAARNATALAADVRFVAGDWFNALGDHPDERFDLIVANPPYVAADDAHLDAGDLRFEPRAALTDFGDGLSALSTIVAGAPRRLASGGTLLVEHGHDQADPVRRLFAAAGFAGVASSRDLATIERVTGGRIISPASINEECP